MRNVWLPHLSVVPILFLIPWVKAADSDFEKNAEAQWKAAAAVSDDYAAYEKRELRSWRAYQKRIKQKWADGAGPEQKTYVEYLDSDTARVRIDYERGVVTAEALLDEKGSQAAAKKVQAALDGVMSNGSSPGAVLPRDDLMARSASGSAMTERTTVAGDGRPRVLYSLSIKMVPDFIKRRAARYKPIVATWASKFGLDPAYVLAIIRQESSFNPRARSSIPAIGLMQVVPRFAGQEVLKAITGKATTPDVEFLYDPERNIMVGSTYLQLLRDQYFPNVTDKAKQMYLMTASYNWGPHRIKTAISKGRIPASASSADTFDAIQRIAPEETKNYVRKVSEYYIEFKKEGL